VLFLRAKDSRSLHDNEGMAMTEIQVGDQTFVTIASNGRRYTQV